MSLSLSHAGRILLDVLYPRSCALCGSGGAFLCAACESRLPRAEGARCGRCWLPLRGENCRACATDLPAFAMLRSRYQFGGDVRKLVHAVKFERRSSLAEDLGLLLAQTAAETGIVADALVPVPLRRMGQRERGFNQAAVMAESAAEVLQLPVMHALRRAGSSLRQTEAKSLAARRANARGAFSLRSGSPVVGRALLLVDDVATTGATLDACARVLLAAGAASVSAATLARED